MWAVWQNNKRPFIVQATSVTQKKKTLQTLDVERSGLSERGMSPTPLLLHRAHLLLLCKMVDTQLEEGDVKGNKERLRLWTRDTYFSVSLSLSRSSFWNINGPSQCDLIYRPSSSSKAHSTRLKAVACQNCLMSTNAGNMRQIGWSDFTTETLEVNTEAKASVCHSYLQKS